MVGAPISFPSSGQPHHSAAIGTSHNLQQTHTYAAPISSTLLPYDGQTPGQFPNMNMPTSHNSTHLYPPNPPTSPVPPPPFPPYSTNTTTAYPQSSSPMTPYPPNSGQNQPYPPTGNPSQPNNHIQVPTGYPTGQSSGQYPPSPSQAPPHSMGTYPPTPTGVYPPPY